MDRAFTPHEAKLNAELAGTYDRAEAAMIRADLERIRAESERVCRETLARVQAVGQRQRVPAPPAPPFRPLGPRERAASALLSNRRSHT